MTKLTIQRHHRYNENLRSLTLSHYFCIARYNVIWRSLQRGWRLDSEKFSKVWDKPGCLACWERYLLCRFFLLVNIVFWPLRHPIPPLASPSPPPPTLKSIPVFSVPCCFYTAHVRIPTAKVSPTKWGQSIFGTFISGSPGFLPLSDGRRS